MKRKEILEVATKCVCGGRECDHGQMEDNFRTTADLWNAYHGREIFCPHDVAMMLALLKVARIKSGMSEDSYCDLAGYAACAGEIAGRLNGE